MRMLRIMLPQQILAVIISIRRSQNSVDVFVIGFARIRSQMPQI